MYGDGDRRSKPKRSPKANMDAGSETRHEFDGDEGGR